METNQEINRRAVLTAAATVPLATLAHAAPVNDDRLNMIAVIEELEAWQGWESSDVVAAKSFAAYKMRKALGLDLPDPEYAQMHVDYQGSQFDNYRRSYCYERDREAGKLYRFTEELA